jgi:hypothetical protein
MRKSGLIKKIIFWGVLLAIPIFLIFVSTELFYKFYWAKRMLYQYDQELGWVPKPDFFYDETCYDSEKTPYKVKLSTNEYGFRAWGDVNSDKKKILFIGDSFTGDPNMSDKDAYFDQVRRLTGAEVFAFGGGGYGTLQELMILRKYVKKIDPDYFVLQYCSNDIDNNSYELEGTFLVRNQKDLRPYFDGQRIIYRLPFGHWYRTLFAHSAVFRFLDHRLQMIQYRLYGGYEEPSAKDDQERADEIARAEKITVQLLRQMADSVPLKTKLLTFSSDTENPEWTARWLRVAKAAGFIPLPGVSRAVEKAEQQGVVVRAADGGHWGPEGHHIAGAVLAKELERLGVE